MRAFAAHCGLPTLSGKPPFGGHILSHDFVEAALIRRAGWTVYMLPDLDGSYEESPPSLIDLADARPALVPGQPAARRASSAPPACTWPTRQHFATGIMSYLASPLWLAQLLVGIVLVLQTRYVRPEYFTARVLAVPDLAAVRRRARAAAVRDHHGDPARAEAVRPAAGADPRRGCGGPAAAASASSSRRSSRSSCRR